MKYLLDTETFLYWISDDARLSAKVQSIIEDVKNEIFFSSASAMEISIRMNLKQMVKDNPLSFITEQLRMNDFTPLTVDVSHALYVGKLPSHHKDPYDRVIISQSILEKMPVLTGDDQFKPYDVVTVW